MAKRQRQRRQGRRRKHAERRRSGIRRSVLTGSGLTIGAALGLAAPALGAAQAYYVGTLADDGSTATDCTDPTNTDCTLRQAISDANANSGQYDYVVFKSGLTGTIHLGTGGGPISITDATYFDGGNHGGLIPVRISGDYLTRIFDVDTSPGDVVSIYRMFLAYGDASGNGGAIRDQDAAVRLYDSMILRSHADGSGGAIYEYGGERYGAGTAIWYSTLSGNSAGGDGGAIASQSTVGSIYLSTLASNSAVNGGAASAGPAGVTYLSGISSSTISGNTATGSGGGIFATGSRLSVISSIVANNSAPSAADIHPDGYLRADYSLFEVPPSSITTGHHNILRADPHLGPLLYIGPPNNGGITPTMKPANDSPVVDQGNSYNYADQRGYPRPIDNPYVANVPAADGTDIGSVELSYGEGPGPPTTAPSTPPPAPPAPRRHKRRCKKRHGRTAEAARKRCKKKKGTGQTRRFGFRRPARTEPWPGASQRHPFRLDN